jgi:hypothetical protein
MKKVYLVSPFWGAHPKAIFETRKDAEKFIEEFGAPSHQVLEYVLWKDGQEIKEIINPIAGFTHADYGKKYYGFCYWDSEAKKPRWSGKSPEEKNETLSP